MFRPGYVSRCRAMVPACLSLMRQDVQKSQSYENLQTPHYHVVPGNCVQHLGVPESDGLSFINFCQFA